VLAPLVPPLLALVSLALPLLVLMALIPPLLASVSLALPLFVLQLALPLFVLLVLKPLVSRFFELNSFLLAHILYIQFLLQLHFHLFHYCRKLFFVLILLQHLYLVVFFLYYFLLK